MTKAIPQDTLKRERTSHVPTRSPCGQRWDIIDCQFNYWQLIAIINGIGSWQIIAIINWFFISIKK